MTSKLEGQLFLHVYYEMKTKIVIETKNKVQLFYFITITKELSYPLRDRVIKWSLFTSKLSGAFECRCYIVYIVFEHKNHKENLPNVIDKICTNWLFVFCSLMGVENRSANATFVVYCTKDTQIEFHSRVFRVLLVIFNTQ